MRVSDWGWGVLVIWLSCDVAVIQFELYPFKTMTNIHDPSHAKYIM